MIKRGVEQTPNEVFTRVELDSAEDQEAFREHLLASGALDRTTVLTPPTVVELVENITYLVPAQVPVASSKKQKKSRP